VPLFADQNYGHPSECNLINALYPELGHGHKNDQYFLDHTILSCKNDGVHDLNTQMLEIFPGGERLYISAKSVVMEDGVQNDFQPIPVESLNSVTASGLPLAPAPTYTLSPFLYSVISGVMVKA
jgi:hypothetical protein